MTRRVLGAIVTGLAALGAGAPAQAQGGAPPSPVRVAPAVLEDVAVRRMVTGQLRSLRMAEVAAQEPGVVVEMLVDVGQRVEAGQLLARLDDERLAIEKDRLIAERAATSSIIAEEAAARDRWQSEVELLRGAAEAGASNAREHRDAEVVLRQAAARLEKAERDVEVYGARLALIERRLKDMRIAAPFAGVVTRKLTELGEWVAEGDSVCEIVTTDELEVVLDVPQGHMPALAAGPLAGENFVVKLDAAGQPVAIEDVRIVPQVDERSRTFHLVAKVRNEAGVLASGLSVVGWVPTGESGQHLVVPVDAIMRNEMGPYVYVARQLGEGPPQAMPANVSVLFEMPGRVVIAPGAVREGDRVVIEGAERLYPTAPLAPSEKGGPGVAAAREGGTEPAPASDREGEGR